MHACRAEVSTRFFVVCTIAAAAGAMLPCATAGAAITGALREVRAQMSGQPMQSQSGPGGLGTWTGTASSTGSSGALPTVTSTQTTTLTATSIVANGSIGYSRLMQDLTTGFGDATVDSFFQVTEPTPYTLVGNVGAGTSGSIILQGQSGVVHSGSVLNVSGVLAPGGYELSMRIRLDVPQTGPGSAPWTMAFNIPSPSAGAAALTLSGLTLGWCRRRRSAASRGAACATPVARRIV